MYFEHDPNMPALRREWLGARIVGALGVVFIVAVAAFGIYVRSQGLPVAPPPQAAAPDNPAARRAEDIAICDAALAETQREGILPAYAKRDGDAAVTTSVQGRYICRAATEAARYAIVFDLGCTRLGEPNCIGLYTVEQEGGGTIYQRK